MSANENALLTSLLEAVSRSFYLTLRVLPRPVRRQIGLAYLLARATDTIADTELVPVTERLAALGELRARIVGERRQPLDFQRLAAAQPERAGGGTGAERVLLRRIEEAITVLQSFSARDRQLIEAVLRTITSGQQLDLERFGAADAGHIASLATAAELDDYTYRVAGCVGEFWTAMCREHLFPKAKLDDRALLANGVRFGKGLQLVNILRDLPRDLHQGRCYIPSQSLAAAALSAADLTNAANEPRFRAVYNPLLDTASGHLAAGWEYTKMLPRSCMRVRLACAWPVLIGARTLARLREQNVLDPEQRIKVSHTEVRDIMVATILRYPFRGWWNALYAKNSTATHRS